MIDSIQNGTDSSTAGSAVDETWFESYHPYADHIDWLNDLQAQFSTKSEIVTSGETYEGENITGLHFYGSSGGGTNPAVVFHGSVHAREWITSMVSCTSVIRRASSDWT